MDEKKHPCGRKPYQPTEKAKGTVESAVAFGISQVEIAGHLHIDVKTLCKYFKEELREGAFKAHMSVAGELYRLCLHSIDESVRYRSICYYTSRQMGWKAPEPEGVVAPIPVIITRDDSKL